MNQYPIKNITFYSLLLLILSLSSLSVAMPTWQSVEQLVKQQKLTAASQEVDAILTQAIAKKDPINWRRALITGTDYRLTQGKAETAITFLQQQKWPQDKPSQLILNLYYAEALSRYIRRYHWEISQREPIESTNKTALKQMTQTQLIALTNATYQHAWKASLVWQDSNLDAFKRYFNTGTFPKRIRGTLSDTVTYLWVHFLGDESLWSAVHSNQTYQLNLHTLLTPSQKKRNPTNHTIHPLKRITWLLASLEQWHIQAKRPEAAFEAARIRIERIAKSLRNTKDQQRIQHALRTRTQQVATLPWSTMGYWSLAKLLKQHDTPDGLIKTKTVLDQCISVHTKSEGSQQCHVMRNNLLKTSFYLEAMQTDGIKKRSIAVTHNNIKQLYFRAWNIDLLAHLKKSPAQRDQFIQQLILQKKPNQQWTTALATSKDYRPHRTFITPPMTQRGYWIIAASDTKIFNNKSSHTSAVALNLTHLTAVLNHHKKDLEVTVYQGESGHLSHNSTVELWQDKRAQAMQKIATVVTDHHGRAKLPVKTDGNYMLLIKHDTDIASLENIYHYQPYEQHQQKSALLFTDRSIYRPEQTLQWKVVAYQGHSNTGKFRTLANTTGWVELLDSNNKTITKTQITTNAYGSASGKFTIKKGRMLGQWQIKTSWGSYNSIRIEDYKRPTFSAKIDDSKTALRLNQPAKITGTARYYFGQKVTDGKVNWSVTREPIFDWHRYRYRPRPHASIETIASGTSSLDSKGQFNLVFLPQGDQRLKHANYTFKVSADITDSGGETRTATRRYRLGTVAIKTTLEANTAFALEGESYALNLSRTDLDDTPRSGSATWRLTRLQQPNAPRLPAELPETITDKKKAYATTGDKQSPRWNNALDVLSNWSDAQEIRKGLLQHDQTGKAQLELKGLTTGAYRLHYTTFDQWKQRFTTQHEIVIGAKQHTSIQLPALLKAKREQVEVGENIELLLGSGFKNLPVTLEVYHGNTRLKRNILQGGIQHISFPVVKAYRGGLDFILTAVKDFQVLQQRQHISVPWTDRQLNVSFRHFRDKLQPGQKETWRITVKDSKGKPLETGAAEVLVSMYDRSLDFFSTLTPPNPLSLYASINSSIRHSNTQHVAGSIWQYHPPLQQQRPPKKFTPTQLMRHANNHRRGLHNARASMAPQMTLNSPVNVLALQRKLKLKGYYNGVINGIVGEETRASLTKFMKSKRGDSAKEKTSETIDTAKIRTNFSETAFFFPHLTLEQDGSVSFEFEVPDALTEWTVWLSAITRDLRSGSISKKVKTSKALMVRPYLPRFLREGDRADIEVVINNSSDKTLSGELEFEIFDPETEKSLNHAFKLQQPKRPYHLEAGKSTHLRFALNTPHKAGIIAIRTTANSDELSDGEQRALPILPSRIHLTQSRFTTLQNNDSQTLSFQQLADNNDPSRINNQLVVTVEGQLFYSVLNALPYLVDYPHESTEQTLNRYLSTSIIKSVFDQHPAIASMAKKVSKRNTHYEAWNKKDANRTMLLEETPWLLQAEGGKKSSEKLLRILDPKIAATQRKEALQKLQKAQTKSGGFPWWSGGRASPYMTLYMLHGFSRALEFKSPVPKKMIQNAWRYLHAEFNNKLIEQQHLNELTFINYLLSTYPDSSWTGGVFTQKQHQTMLAQSFQQWTKLPTLLKSYLALTLHRAGQTQKAKLVFDSIMDSAKTDPQRGTYWSPEDRSWLWYNDTIDTHAFILRTLTELNPKDPRRQGIVQWLMLNKKLNHWKSTRATAESIYALVHYLKDENQLGITEKVTINIGKNISKQWTFTPDDSTGQNNQLIVTGEKITPDMAKTTLSKNTKGLLFASATWHFSTKKLPKQAQGDFFHIKRTFYKRIKKGQQWTLQPLAENASIAIGDQLEVQLLLRSKHNTEYIHLRSPRAAGYEPINQTSGYQWQMGLGYYEEIRDSGTNYFFDHLPAGEYHFKYQLRATTAGQFHSAPAKIQSVYAPEFNAYSSGNTLVISP
jgi:uncharacterized protein YfaS (alpha-2-macroglobulin family)